ncbi:MAG: TldD/PmbA family protein [Planctomycetes bacterium]|nr:TldD/PmbA family protein [Planctomycetota bacterium]
MLSRDEANALCKRVLKQCDAEGAEAIISSSETNSTRFSNNVITQNVGLTNQRLCLRVIQGKRQGVARVNQFDDASIKRCVQSALAVCRVAAEDDKLETLLDKQPEYTNVDAFKETTAKSTPAARAEAIGKVLREYDANKVEGAGIFDADQGAIAYSNSKGVFAYKANTKAEFSISAFLERGEIEGWAEAFGLDISKLDVAATAKRAMHKAVTGVHARAIEPGEYTVVLEAPAVAELLLFYGWLGTNGLAFAENRTFHKGKLGQKLFSDKFTLTEDPYHPELGGTPFDMEGFPTQRVTLIDKGVIAAVVHDRRSAKLVNAKNTGHANMQPDAQGPSPGNLVLATGDQTLEQMIGSTKKGLLITKFHYCNVVDRMDLSLTGMTRSGTFMIEDGKVAYPVKNMRFTQSLLTAFADVAAVGKEAHATGGALFGGNFVVPALKLNKFRFSSPTGF